ncbi:hypothetical protein GCM10009087_53030 [Sphingomonas oligophenolica]|uniref:Copper chaperone PCu(A)C n=1 Tax=Sphingomonas oligophenolica TaxID=301154 RepID=A0ABU9Y7R6_9SPHN
MKPASLAPFALAILIAAPLAAHEYKLGPLAIAHPWARETAVGQTVGGGFTTIANRGARDDRLLAATSPVAAQVQLHTMSMDGGIMRMRQVTDGIPIPAHGAVELKPGGLHIMFMGLVHPLRRGERIPATLRFQHAGNVRVEFLVQPVSSSEAGEAGHGGH